MAAAGRRNTGVADARLGAPIAMAADAAAVVPRKVRRSRFLSDISDSGCGGGGKMESGGEGCQHAVYFPTDD